MSRSRPKSTPSNGLPAISRPSGPGESKELRQLRSLLDEISVSRATIVGREAVVVEIHRRIELDLRPMETRMIEVRVTTLRVLGGHLRSGRLNKRAARLLESALYDFANELEKEYGLDLEQDRIRIFEESVPPDKDYEEDAYNSDKDGEEDRTGFYQESDFSEPAEKKTADKSQQKSHGKPGGFGGGNQNGGEGGRGKRGNQENKDEAMAGDIRALYLMLARALHPDKESDPTRLADKTRWMQRVTVAYANRDLAMLLDILASNPLAAVGPYLSQAPLKTVQGFTKRLRRELDVLRARLADLDWKLDPFITKFIRGTRINETAFTRYVADVSKQLKFMKQRRDAYKTTQGVGELVEALRKHAWHELM